MIRAKYINILSLISLFCLVQFSYAQKIDTDVKEDKIIIAGKTYYLHVVEKGEGFYGIAKKYGVSQKEIHEANPNAIFGLKPGDILNIPVISGRNSNVEEIKKSKEYVYHTIEKGQTLYFLSKKYNVSIEDIKKNNAGADQSLLVGTIFKIPLSQSDVSEADDPQFTYHKVERKETLYGISRRYNVTVDAIIASNPALKNGVLSVGSRIRIPEAIKEKHAKVKAIEKLEDKNYIYHRIVTGETIFSLSRKYNTSQEVLAQNNPDLDPNELPLGYMVRIPKDAIKKGVPRGRKERDYVIHVVKRKETIYSISNKYNVTYKDIEEVNPTVIVSNIKKGMKLKVPTQEYLAQKELDSQKDAEENLSASRKEIWANTEVDCGRYNYRENKETIKIALLLPFDLEATRKANIIKKIVNDEEVEIEREQPIISSRSRTFVEFYEGALMAVDSLKKQGVNIDLFTYDTAPDTNRVKQILEEPELKMVDFIIGPAYASNLPLVSDFSYEHQIKMVYPLSSVNTRLRENPFLFQVNAPDTLLFSNYANYIINHHEQSRIVLLKSAKYDREEEKLSLEIKNQLFMKYLPLGKNPDFMEISFSEKNVQGVEALLDKEKLNVVVIPSPDEADVSKIVTTLHGVAESSDIKIKLIGFGSWLKFQTINAEEVHELNTEILTPYALDYSDDHTNNFILEYRKLYYTEPFAVAPYFIRSGRNSRYSRYGIWGFDVMYYFLSARVKYGNQFEYCLADYKAKQVQFNFSFKRSENWGGFYNEGVYVLGFKPTLEIFRAPLQ
ncbi:LysM peptidoglycan-binding domain-containing protein [Labilibacter sediminis]|nr:LysM peptidoglycan-binding domain-containing protein [Labilibacter sediminis]